MFSNPKFSQEWTICKNGSPYDVKQLFFLFYLYDPYLKVSMINYFFHHDTNLYFFVFFWSQCAISFYINIY